MPALIALLDEGPVALAALAEELLERLAGEIALPAVAGTDNASRHRARRPGTSGGAATRREWTLAELAEKKSISV